MQVTVDRERCCSSGNCIRLVPEVFDADDHDGTTVLLQPAPPERLRADLEDAADQCPTEAIEVR